MTVWHGTSRCSMIDLRTRSVPTAEGLKIYNIRMPNSADPGTFRHLSAPNHFCSTHSKYLHVYFISRGSVYFIYPSEKIFSLFAIFSMTKYLFIKSAFPYFYHWLSGFLIINWYYWQRSSAHVFWSVLYPFNARLGFILYHICLRIGRIRCSAFSKRKGERLFLIFSKIILFAFIS